LGKIRHIAFAARAERSGLSTFIKRCDADFDQHDEAVAAPQA
jgi:hypothetical protein